MTKTKRISKVILAAAMVLACFPGVDGAGLRGTDDYDFSISIGASGSSLYEGPFPSCSVQQLPGLVSLSACPGRLEIWSKILLLRALAACFFGGLLAPGGSPDAARLAGGASA